MTVAAQRGVRQITSLGARVTEVPLHPSISGDGSRISFATRRNVNGGNSDGSVELYLYDLPTATFFKDYQCACERRRGRCFFFE